MKQFIVVMLLAFSSLAAASGSRNVEITNDTLEKTPVMDSINQEDLLKYHYVGSEGNWHVVAKLETNYSGGMPWSNVFIKKVAKEKFAVIEEVALRKQQTNINQFKHLWDVLDKQATQLSE